MLAKFVEVVQSNELNASRGGLLTETSHSRSASYDLLSRKNALPSWVLRWFILASLLCIWDASFIFLRPWSLPEGALQGLWMPYRLYITVDQRYMDQNDGFVLAISLLNSVEVFLNGMIIVMHYRRNPQTVTLAFTVSVMTFYKTILYLLMSHRILGDAHYGAGVTIAQDIFLFFVPNGVWVILPFAIMVVLWNQIGSSHGDGESAESAYTRLTSSLQNGDIVLYRRLTSDHIAAMLSAERQATPEKNVVKPT